MFPNKERLSYIDGDNPLTELQYCLNAVKMLMYFYLGILTDKLEKITYLPKLFLNIFLNVELYLVIDVCISMFINIWVAFF